MGDETDLFLLEETKYSERPLPVSRGPYTLRYGTRGIGTKSLGGSRVSGGIGGYRVVRGERGCWEWSSGVNVGRGGRSIEWSR